MLSVVGTKSHGLMSLVPKTADGKAITDYEANIIYNTSNGTKKELKEWYAVVSYLQSFDKVNGIPQISASYERTKGRKIVDDSKNIFVLLKNPNKISLTVYIAVPVILILVTMLIIKIVKRIRKKK
jgi:hypothetical protein